MQKTSVSLLLIFLGSGFFYYFYTHKNDTPVLIESVTKGQYQPIPDGPLANKPLTLAEQAAKNQEEIAKYNASIDAYGFPGEIDLTAYLYNPPTVLYEENGFMYEQLNRETEGNMPIVKVSSTTREYVGLTSNYSYLFSPNKHLFAYIRTLGPGDSRIHYGDLCVVQINPKFVQCLAPKNSNETFTRLAGDYEQAVATGVWLNNTTLQYSVYKKTPNRPWGEPEDAQPIRTEIFNFSPTN